VAPPAAGGFTRLSARVVGGLPLPDAALADPALAELARAGAEGRNVQPDIDVLAARHLGIGPDAASSLTAVAPADDRR